MRNTTLGTITLVSLLAFGGCDKGSGMSGKQSGKLRAHEASLLEALPGGNVALFGGNFMRIQKFFEDGPMARVMDQVEEVSPGLKKWNECFLEGDVSKIKIAGAVAYADDAATLTFVMKGFTVKGVEACANKAGFPATVDPDGKFVSIQMQNPQIGEYQSGYLELADGTLFSRQAMPFPPGMGAPPSGSTRADLEAAAASTKTKNAAGDEVLVGEAARIDRDHAMWFVANLNGTPAGDTVGLVRGWVEIEGGLDMDVSVQITDKETADQIAEGIPMMKKEAGRAGKEVGDIIKKLRYERSGDRFRFGLKITNKQMESLMSSMGGMLGGGL